MPLVLQGGNVAENLKHLPYMYIHTCMHTLERAKFHVRKKTETQSSDYLYLTKLMLCRSALFLVGEARV